MFAEVFGKPMITEVLCDELFDPVYESISDRGPVTWPIGVNSKQVELRGELRGAAKQVSSQGNPFIV